MLMRAGELSSVKRWKKECVYLPPWNPELEVLYCPKKDYSDQEMSLR